METSSLPGKIQVSEATANILINAGKANWVTKRDEIVSLKGKGEMTSYWLSLQTKRGSFTSTDGSSASKSIDSQKPKSGELSSHAVSKKTSKLISWNVETLAHLLKQIIAQRGVDADRNCYDWPKRFSDDADTVFDEVQEIVSLPKFSGKGGRTRKDPNSVKLSPAVEEQLVEFVTNLAMMYRQNPFHNFDHASHVTMSVTKLLGRIVAPRDMNYDEISTQRALASKLHDHTYGITSDPLTQFACVLSALIHDVDHTGVPNAQLVKEEADVAKTYKNVSVAEQNSIDIAWELLMSDSFKDLRAAIAQTEADVRRFRQLVVNVVLATDIVDKNLKALRNQRWDRAFKADEYSVSTTSTGSKDEIDRKATIVIEHLIQASDVAHTMQHWHVYKKWNGKLFQEMSKAYRDGRAMSDPAESWYKGELGFFDFYIIPLAKKLKECGVFGVSSDEYLQYAMSNRKEWEEKGHAVVAQFVEEFQKEYDGN